MKETLSKEIGEELRRGEGKGRKIVLKKKSGNLREKSWGVVTLHHIRTRVTPLL